MTGRFQQCSARKSGGAGTAERQCLLEAGHERSQKYLHPGHLKREGCGHEFAPICRSCGKVEDSWPGRKENEHTETKKPRQVGDPVEAAAPQDEKPAHGPAANYAQAGKAKAEAKGRT